MGEEYPTEVQESPDELHGRVGNLNMAELAFATCELLGGKSAEEIDRAILVSREAGEISPKPEGAWW
jgi:hypothetical protein